MFNSKNIKGAYGIKPDLMIYAGVTGTKFWANYQPDEDEKIIDSAVENIKRIEAKKTVLISSVDVYSDLNGHNENYEINIEKLHAYGRHRYELEQWVINNIEDYLIIRLPALYGINIKKNFIYDLIYHIPPMLKNNVIENIAIEFPAIYDTYTNAGNGYYECRNLTEAERRNVKTVLKNFNIDAINFTDSRAEYQFYNLKYLYQHIMVALKNNIKILNIVTEPISAAELCEFVDNTVFENQISEHPIMYNLKTKYDRAFKGANGYICSKGVILDDLKRFVLMQRGEC
ncbi:sugar nucleotide-binding protein [uncultured Clostridium sp.]|uniref:sugar nucleotide-binding protein n=1 Tax=uncultured Clostridium sp. TaxID=59620 RepID=UPI0025EDF042|nr:sugar nucleotide-binding protein [uncultured Clostridium sp.]